MNRSGLRPRYEFDDVVVDADRYCVEKAGVVRPIGPRAFDLLLALVSRPDRLLEKQELIDLVWKGAAVTDNALTRAIKEIRDVIGDAAGSPRYVQTVTRRGYRFIASLREARSPDRVTVAVLPFADLSREPQDYFCDGLTEELTTQLARVNPGRLSVVARASVRAYRDRETRDLAAVGRVLGAGYLVEGSVRRHGARVRIAVQLTDVAAGRHVWAESYDEDLADLLSTQGRVAEAVAEAIRVELGPAVSRQVGARSVDPDAYSAYLKARYCWNRRTAAAVAEAATAFEEAIRREPGFAPAHVGLARCKALFIVAVLPRATAQPVARAAVRRALVLDADLAEAHATLGMLECVDRNYAAGERAFRQAVRLDAGNAATHHWLAMHYLADLGRYDEALEALGIAQSLDPLALISRSDVAAVYCMMGQPTRALEQCRRVLEVEPSFARIHLYRGWGHSLLDQRDEALEAFRAARRFDDSPFTDAWLGYGYARAGHRQQAAAVLDGLRRLVPSGHEVALLEACVLAGLGQAGPAIACLDRAVDERTLGVTVAADLPPFVPLRRDPRFRAVADRLAASTGHRFATGRRRRATSSRPRSARH